MSKRFKVNDVDEEYYVVDKEKDNILFWSNSDKCNELCELLNKLNEENIDLKNKLGYSIPKEDTGEDCNIHFKEVELVTEIRKTTDEMIKENNFSLTELVLRIDWITDRLDSLEQEKEELEAELVNNQGLIVAMVYK